MIKLAPFILLAVFISCTFIETKTVNVDYNGKEPQINFTEETLDFGKMSAGEAVEGSYFFKNTGEAPLIVTNVKASCGCTTPIYTTKPVMPGEQGSITARFDSKGFKGTVYKSINVFTNANTKPIILYLVAQIKE